MKKAFRSFIIALLCISCFVTSATYTFAEEAIEEGITFSGKRSVVFLADKSNLDNFIDGGRSALDLILRNNSPEWLDTKTTADGRDVLISLEFSFGSFEDYRSKIGELLTRESSMILSYLDGIVLLEDYSPFELLEMTENTLEAIEFLNEKTLEELITLQSNDIEINSKLYSFGNEAIIIRPGNDELITFDLLEIDTLGNEDSSFTRKITVKPTKNEKMVKKRFSSVEDAKTDVSNGLVTVEFNAADRTELCAKTIICLNSAAYITEDKKITKEDTMSVSCEEFIDTGVILTEGSSFSYSFTCPEHYKNINSDMISDSDSKMIVATDTDSIRYSYEYGLIFTDVSISTDMTDLFGKITRTVTLSAPLDIASHLHEKTMKELKSRLPKGVTLSVYDKNDVKFYEFKYSAWFDSDVEDFTNKIFDAEGTFKINPGIMPLQKGTVVETSSYESFLPNTNEIQIIKYSYKLPKSAKIFISSAYEEEVTVNGTSITFNMAPFREFDFEYYRMNYVKMILCILVFIILLVTVIIITVKIKKLIKKKNSCR